MNALRTPQVNEHKKVVTDSYTYADVDKKGKVLNRSARLIKVTEKNIFSVDAWLGDSSEIVTTFTKKHGNVSKLRVKTEKGLRTALIGDRILKFGKGAASTYLVFKVL